MILFIYYEGDVLNNISKIFESGEMKCVSVGTLSSEQIDFLKNKCPDVFNNVKTYTIVIWKDRLQHISKHSYDASNLSVDEMIDLLPQIIESPDYLGYRDKDSSIQFIKKIKNNILVAVRTDSKGRLTFRTMYTITEGQLSDYIKKNHAWEFSVDKVHKD